MPFNKAAWLSRQGASLSVKEAPYPTLEPSSVIVKTAAIALNLIDWKMRDFGILVQSWPCILGCDIAGTVVEISPNVSHVQVGDRVACFATGLATGQSTEGAFQLYTRVQSTFVTIIPDNITLEEAVVLPLSVACAAAVRVNSSRNK